MEAFPSFSLYSGAAVDPNPVIPKYAREADACVISPNFSKTSGILCKDSYTIINAVTLANRGFFSPVLWSHALAVKVDLRRGV